MSSFVSRLVACLVAVVAVLQLIHLVLLNQLENRRLNTITQIQQQFHPLLPEDFGSNSPNEKPISTHTNNNNRRRKLRESYSRGHVDFNENEVLMDRLFREEEGTIVDSAGEYRVVFDIAGPQRDILSQSQSPSQIQNQVAPQEKPFSLPTNNDDFSIDEDITDLEPSPSEDLTLVTHADLSTAKKYLMPLVERWNGPISLVLYASNSSSVEATIDFIAQARLCSDIVRQYVNFHIVFPLVETHIRYTNSNPNRRNSNKTRQRTYPSVNTGTKRNRDNSGVNVNANLDLEAECQYFQDQKDGAKFYKTSRESDPLDLISGGSSGGINLNYIISTPPHYPTNLLRNVGRKRVLTDYSLVIPLYMVPSEGLRAKFHQMLKKRKDLDEKTVFVIPSFETKNQEMPGTKGELLKLIQNYQARPYHFELCWKCQVHTDYESWGRELGKEEELSVMFEVLWKDPWEPFFISMNSIPLFNEGFRHLTFDRLSQLCELHVGGYKFAVLNEPFLLHPGYITPTPFHLTLTKDTNANLDTNRARFRQFKHELKNKYPHSTRRCY